MLNDLMRIFSVQVQRDFVILCNNLKKLLIQVSTRSIKRFYEAFIVLADYFPEELRFNGNLYCKGFRNLQQNFEVLSYPFQCKSHDIQFHCVSETLAKYLERNYFWCTLNAHEARFQFVLTRRISVLS